MTDSSASTRFGLFIKNEEATTSGHPGPDLLENEILVLPNAELYRQQASETVSTGVLKKALLKQLLP